MGRRTLPVTDRRVGDLLAPLVTVVLAAAMAACSLSPSSTTGAADRSVSRDPDTARGGSASPAVDPVGSDALGLPGSAPTSPTATPGAPGRTPSEPLVPLAAPLGDARSTAARPTGAAAAATAPSPAVSTAGVPPTASASPRAGTPGAGGATAGGTSTRAATSTPATSVAAILNAVVAGTNRERRQAGCPDLVADPALTLVALAHSAAMARSNFFAHNSLDGTTPFQRIAAAGIPFAIAAENIAAGQPTPVAVLRSWMASPGHRANILNCTLRRVGVGFAVGGSYGTYWVQDFVTPPR
ncbi:exported hypothetical protein [Frankia sp. AiPs1]